MSWAKEAKKSLTETEVLQVAHAVLVCGVSQHHLAGMFGVDSGRVAEAVVAVRWAAENHKTIYRHVRKRRTNGHNTVPEPKLISSDPFHPSNRGWDGPGTAD